MDAKNEVEVDAKVDVKTDTKVDENKGVKVEANMDVKGGATRLKCTNQAQNQVQNPMQITPQFVPDLEKGRKKCLKQHQPVKLHHFVQRMRKNTLKYGLDAKKDAKRDAKSSFCCSGHMCQDTELGDCFQAIC